jgi:signal peptidase I
MQRALRQDVPESAPEAQSDSPSPALAAGLGLLPFAWGLGQWYAGARGRAALMHFLQLGVMIGAFYALPRFGAVVIALPLLCWLASAADAYLLARATPAFRDPRRRRLVSTTVFWIASNVVVNAGAQFLEANVVGKYNVASSEMAPALLPGDVLLVDRRAYREREPQLGDLVLVRDPEAPPQSKGRQVLRVVGRGGDSVELRAQTLYVNGERISGGRSQPYTPPGGEEMVSVEERLGEHRFRVLRDADDLVFQRPSRYGLEPDQFFVLGDNRAAARDSRSYGALPRSAVLGRVLYRVLALQAGTARMDWDRLGTLP